MTIDRLDEVFKCIYHFEGQFNFTNIHNKLNEPFQGLETLPYRDSNEVIIIIKKLSNDGMIELVSNGQYLITFNGKLFYENTPKRYLGKPYKYREIIKNNNAIWIKVKTIATVINAIILIAIGIATCKNSEKEEIRKNQPVKQDSTKKIIENPLETPKKNKKPSTN